MSAKPFMNFTQPQRGVEETAQLLQRLYLVERETMRALGGWHMAVETWELKTLTPQHWWHDSLHADAMRRRVLELRYGLGGEHPRTLDEVGRTFNVTRERIRQIENQSLKKLQSLAEAQKLREVA